MSDGPLDHSTGSRVERYVRASAANEAQRVQINRRREAAGSVTFQTQQVVMPPEFFMGRTGNWPTT